MGQAKQLLPWGKYTLIEHQLQTLSKTGMPVVVVLGHLYERILPVIQHYPVLSPVHTQWDEGMGSTISFGVREVKREFPEAAGILVCQVDQPLITSAHYKRLLEGFQAGSRQIIVSRSTSGWEGVPVLFDRYYFKELQNLGGEQGARKIFRSHSRAVQIIESSDILDDMDHPVAYEQLLAQYRP